MKHLLCNLCLGVASVAFLGTASAQDTTTTTRTDYSDRSMERGLQLGADFLVPYRVSDPNGRTSSLIGAHASLFVTPATTVDMQAIFGVEDQGFDEDPIFIAPGLSAYMAPGRLFEPVLSVAVPILLNAGNDVGIRGGLGFMWNVLPALGLKYSFDGTYFFDSEAVSLNLAHVSAVFNW